MGYNKSLSAVYSDIWERYKHHCEREGMIALNRFCEGEGIKVQRLYEWLRRRKISISDYQDSLSGMPAGVRNHEEALFRKVRLPRPSPCTRRCGSRYGGCCPRHTHRAWRGHGHESGRDCSQWSDDADGGSYTQRGCGGLSLISGCGSVRGRYLCATVSAV